MNFSFGLPRICTIKKINLILVAISNLCISARSSASFSALVFFFFLETGEEEQNLVPNLLL